MQSFQVTVNQQSSATVLTWNGGSSGSWVNQEKTWLDGSNTPCARIDGARRSFLGTGTVSVDDDINAASIQFAGGPFTIGGASTITLVGEGGNITVEKTVLIGVDATISCQLAGAFGMTKLGSGTLMLSHNKNSYTGLTTIREGTLRQGSDGALGSPTNSVLVTGVVPYWI